jgi:hypothetical protein
MDGNGLYEADPTMILGTERPGAYIKVESGYTEVITSYDPVTDSMVQSTHKLIKIKVYNDVTLTDQTDADMFVHTSDTLSDTEHEFIRFSLDEYGTGGHRLKLFDFAQEIISNDPGMSIYTHKSAINKFDIKLGTTITQTDVTVNAETSAETQAILTDDLTANIDYRTYKAQLDEFVKPNYYVKAKSNVEGLRPRFLKIVSVAGTTQTDPISSGVTVEMIKQENKIAEITGGTTVNMQNALPQATWGARVYVKKADGSDLTNNVKVINGTVSGNGTQITLDSSATNAQGISINIYRNRITTTVTETYYKLNVTTMVPSDKHNIGVDLDVFGADNNEAKMVFIKGIKNYVSAVRGVELGGFKLRDAQMPDGTAQRETDILKYLYTQTNIAKTLAEGLAVDFRYIIDTYQGAITASSKYYLARLAADNGQCLAILNAPSFRQLELSTNPSFLDSTTQLVSPRWVAAGGNLDTNPTVTYSFPDEEVNGVPLGSYAAYFMPNLIVNDNGRNKSIPPAMFVANAFMNKYEAGRPFSIVAGKNGVLSDPEIVNVEYELSQEDRDYMEPAGFNMIVRRRGFGIMVFSNNTSYQKMNSALNNTHVREALATIEKDVERILFNFLFDFNDEITRLRIKTLVEGYLDRVKNAQGVSTFRVVFDATNNGIEVLSANTAIIDIFLDFPRGIHKFINRVTITRVGGGLSSQSTGFIPSF